MSNAISFVITVVVILGWQTARFHRARKDAARLLVILSDGYFDDDECTSGQARITRVTATGCGVLWLHPDAGDRVMRGAHALTLTNPADIADAIGQVATRALRRA